MEEQQVNSLSREGSSGHSPIVDSSANSQNQTFQENSPLIEIGEDSQPSNDGDGGGTNNSKKRKQVSVVWNHFQKKVINGEDKAICNYCGAKLVGKPTDGTNHLRKHYDRCPRRPYKDIRQHILVQEQKKSDGKYFLSNYHFDSEKSRKDLANMIVVHEYPLSIVEHWGFRKYSEGLQALFKVPSRNTVKSDILKIYESEKLKNMEVLEKNKSRIAITSDLWTASNQKKGFMAITAHFIDDNWNMQSRILRFAYVPCPHTSEALSKILMDCMMDWNIDGKLSTFTLDNCSTNDSLISMLLDKLDLHSLMLDGQLFHMRCCAHILNLIVQDGLNVIGEGIERVRNSVSFWTATPKREQSFREAARHCKISSCKKLALDVKTRWNSTYLMLSVALIYKDAFARLKKKEPLYKSLPTDEDWELAQEICGRLEIFHRVTEVFSGTQYPTANFFFPLICEIRLSLQACESSLIPTIQQMSSKMIAKFEKYWSVIHGIMGVAIVLDPQYKLKLLEYFFPKLYGMSAPIEIKRIQSLCYSLFEDYKCKFMMTNESPKQHFNESGSKFDDLMKTNLLDGYDSFVMDTSDLTNKSELDHYLEEKVLPRTPNFDILNWWKTNGVKYPVLQSLARDILAIPISTVASESAFSTSGRLVSPHRSRLHEDTLEALMCAQNWLLQEKQAEFRIGEKKGKRFKSYDSDSDVDDENMESGSTSTSIGTS